jgi:hypothetical protein
MSLLSEIETRVQTLANQEPTMDSHEHLFRCVLEYIAAGAENAVDLAKAALKLR